MQRTVGIGVAIAIAALLGGCAYDYLQRTDRVAYSTGDAVEANLQRQTVNPAKPSMLDTSGLGQNGAVVVVPDPGAVAE